MPRHQNPDNIKRDKDKSLSIDADSMDLPNVSEDEIKFCLLIMKGYSGAKAFVEAFPERSSKMTPGSIAVKSTQLRNHKKIKAWIAALQLAALKEGSITHAEYNAMLMNCISEAMKDRAHGAVSGLMTTLGKSSGFLSERVVVKDERLLLQDQLQRLDKLNPEISKMFREKLQLTSEIEVDGETIN